MKSKCLLVLVCLCVALAACGDREETAEQSAAAPVPAPAEPEQSAVEIIDPYERAATISAPEPAQAPTPAEETAAAEDGSFSASSEPHGESLSEPAPETSVAEPSSGPESRSAHGTLRAAENPPAEGTESAAEAEPAAAAESAAEAAQFHHRAMPAENGTTGIEQALLTMINSERTKEGIETLGVEEAMQLAAGMRAREALQSLSHTRPDGTPYYTAFDEAGFSYAGKWHGENLAMIGMDSESFEESEVAEALFRQWLESPGHQQNMLGDFLQTGIGVYIEWDEDTVRVGAAQLFAGM